MQRIFSFLRLHWMRSKFQPVKHTNIYCFPCNNRQHTHISRILVRVRVGANGVWKKCMHIWCWCGWFFSLFRCNAKRFQCIKIGIVSIILQFQVANSGKEWNHKWKKGEWMIVLEAWRMFIGIFVYVTHSCVHRCLACFCWFPSFSQFDCAVQVDRMFFCSLFPLDSLFRRRVWYSSELEYFHFPISVAYATKDRYNGIYGMKSHLVLNFCWITKRWVKGVNIDGSTSLYWCWAMRIAFHLNCIWGFSWQFACLFTIRYKTTTRQQ